MELGKVERELAALPHQGVVIAASHALMKQGKSSGLPLVLEIPAESFSLRYQQQLLLSLHARTAGVRSTFHI
ncbi:hypothetical protein EK904_008013 [Melospiza melodia maxima]|nr:hypothetical protein EK904_008013 [Melospiza melodia maxima]